jgi:hypothetical protein
VLPKRIAERRQMMLTSYPQYEFITDWIDRTPSGTLDGTAMKRRALSVWPGLDRRKLQRTHGDPRRIARLVETRSGLLFDEILALLVGDRQGA